MVNKYTAVGMPIRGCKETPNAKTGRCRKHPKDPQEEEDVDGVPDAAFKGLACSGCKEITDSATMLVCGDAYGHGCDGGIHMKCLNPPMLAPPPVDVPWFCPDCKGNPKTGEDAERADTVVRRGRTRSETSTINAQRDVWTVDKLVDTRTDAEVRSDRHPFVVWSKP